MSFNIDFIGKDPRTDQRSTPTSLREMFHQILASRIPGCKVLPADDPNREVIGWSLYRSPKVNHRGEVVEIFPEPVWEVDISYIRQLSLPPEVQELFRGATGRQKLAEILQSPEQHTEILETLTSLD